MRIFESHCSNILNSFPSHTDRGQSGRIFIPDMIAGRGGVGQVQTSCYPHLRLHSGRTFTPMFSLWVLVWYPCDPIFGLTQQTISFIAQVTSEASLTPLVFKLQSPKVHLRLLLACDSRQCNYTISASLHSNDPSLVPQAQYTNIQKQPLEHLNTMLSSHHSDAVHPY